MKIQSKFPHLFTKGLLFLFVTALFISCDDALEGKINPHIDMQEEIIINPEGGREVIDLRSSYPWFAEASNSWIQLTRYRGQMQLPDSIVTLIAENPEMEPREGWIEVRLMDQMSTRIIVRQEGRGSLITLPKSVVYFNINGGEAVLPVLTDLEWDTDIEEKDGFTFEAAGKNSLKVKVARNTTGAEREIVVTLKAKDSDRQAKLTVIQSNQEKMMNITLAPEEKDVLFTRDAKSVEIPVILNTEYELEVSGQDWITVTSVPQFGGGDIAEEITIKASVSNNTTGVERTGYIRIKDKSSDISDIYYISQMPGTRRIYVKPGAVGDGTSWENAYGDIQAAASACGNHSNIDIWVAEGEYQLKNSLVLNAVNVYGGFIGTENKLKDRDQSRKSTIKGGDFFLMRSETEGPGDIYYYFDGFVLTGTVTQSNSEWGGVLRIRKRLFSNNIVHGNSFYRAACGYYDNCKIINCLFYGNTTTETSGGIYFLGKTSVYNSSIVNNEIRDQWNSAYVIRVADNIKMYNTVVWGNKCANPKNPQFHVADATACTLYNCVLVNITSQSNYSPIVNNCITNLANDNTGPLFVAPTDGDYRLQSTSPLINKGDNAIIETIGVNKDIIGGMRISDNTVDVGAYEYQVK